MEPQWRYLGGCVAAAEELDSTISMLCPLPCTTKPTEEPAREAWLVPFLPRGRGQLDVLAFSVVMEAGKDWEGLPLVVTDFQTLC